MMYDFEIIGAGGTLTFEDGSPYTIEQIEGLSPPEADIHLHQMALIDGQKYNGAKTQIRTLRIAFAIDGGDVEANRLAAYKVLRIKKPLTVHYKSDFLDVQIEGYLQSVQVSHFEMKQVMTAVILCPEPYWQSAQEIVNSLTRVISMFHFPFHSTEAEPIVFSYVQNLATGTVTNSGEIETGLIFDVAFASSCDSIRIIDYSAGDSFTVEYAFEAGDELKIDTTKGKKTVVLIRDAVETNLFNHIADGSAWFELAPGETFYVFEVTNGMLDRVEISVRHRDLFEGV